MSVSSPPVGPLAPPFPYWRWLGLAGLLLAELILLSLRFDAGTLHQDHQWWADLVRRARLVPQLGIAMALGIAVLAGGRWSSNFRRLMQGQGSSSMGWLFLLGHFLAFAILFQVTATVLEGNIHATAHPELWVLTWLALILATVALWAGAVLPPCLWWALIKSGGGLLALAAVLGGLALWAGELTGRLWEPLGQGTMWLVHLCLEGLYPEVVWDPGNWVIGTPQFRVEIAKQCSGYEGIGLVWIVLVFYLWFFRKTLRFPQVLLLLPLGTAVMWLANVARIVSLIALGNRAPTVATAGFHSQAGWIAFNAVVLGLVGVTRKTRFFSRTEGPLDSEDSANSTVAFLAPLFTILATMMITGAFTVDVDWLYPLRVLTAALVLWLCRRQYGQLGWKFSWEAVIIGVGVFFLWIVLDAIFPAASSPNLSPWQNGWSGTGEGALWVLFRILGSVVTVPLAEELAFRGYLTRRLLAAEFQKVPLGRFSWVSFLASSVLFGALHSHFVAGTLAGMAYALALYRRGRMGDPVLAHASTNALLAIYVLATGRWSLWS